MPSVVRVWAPSRLHFGLLSLGQPAERQYGGAGVMIDAPGLQLIIRRAERLAAAGPLAERVIALARRYADQTQLAGETACQIDVESAAPEHAGLGTGTQLALALAAGLDRLAGRSEPDVARWARLMGRGERSAVGTHGFALGGLLVEGGKLAGEAVSPLVSRIELPATWRFVLAIDRGQRGLSGDAERRAFAALPSPPASATAELTRELLAHLAPGAASGNFAEFGESLYRYGYQAGLLFAKSQGGAYAGRLATRLVEWTRAQGIAGVGQSSWGPTIFALLPDPASAADFATRLRRQFAAEALELVIAAPANRGARIECE